RRQPQGPLRHALARQGGRQQSRDRAGVRPRRHGGDRHRRRRLYPARLQQRHPPDQPELGPGGAVIQASHPPAQRGATLIIALIMLVALAMLSLWSFNAGTMNLRVVGNSQARQEVVAAAQAATELTLSTPLFTQDPLAVAAGAIPIDIDGDAQPDYQARLTPAPACYRVR